MSQLEIFQQRHFQMGLSKNKLFVVLTNLISGLLMFFHSKHQKGASEGQSEIRAVEMNSNTSAEELIN